MVKSQLIPLLNSFRVSGFVEPGVAARSPYPQGSPELSLARSAARRQPSSSSQLFSQSLNRRAASRQKRIPLLRPRQQIRGSLSESDRYVRKFRSVFDEYELRGARVGQRIEITLQSGAFDAYLRLVDARSKRTLLYGEDTPETTNARIVFTVKAGVRYVVQASASPDLLVGDFFGNYILRSRPFPSASSGFNFFYGYGLVDAAAAVAAALPQPQPPFPDVNAAAAPDYDANLSAGADLIKAPEVWAQGFTGQGVIVAVVDTGVDYTDPRLSSRIWTNSNEIAGNGIDDDSNGFVDDIRGWNFMSNTNDPMSSDGHGTAVAGVIAANRVGVATDAQIMPIRVLGNRDESSAVANPIAEGIRYAVNNGARVINLSLGGYDFDPTPAIEVALFEARQKQVTVVISAGNERQELGTVEPSSPAIAALDKLAIAAGAIDLQQRLAKFSNPAGRVPLSYVVAPGERVYTIASGGEYEPMSGTSFSAPFVSGVVALMLSANPNLTPAEIEAILIATAARQGITLTP